MSAPNWIIQPILKVQLKTLELTVDMAPCSPGSELRDNKSWLHYSSRVLTLGRVNSLLWKYPGYRMVVNRYQRHQYDEQSENQQHYKETPA